MSKSNEEEEKRQPIFGRFSRRSFLSQLGAAGIAATAAPLAHAMDGATQTEAATSAPAAAPGAVPVTLSVNGNAHKLHLEPRVTLLDALRENLAMPGTKKGCDHGQCGAFLDHPDTNLNPLGARGVGEVGLTDVASALTMAIHHATGVRVRNLPIRIEDLLA